MKLKHNNSGSATITVVVTMLMIIALGSALLYGAYTSYKIAIAQKRDAENFYTAENAMDDIRFGVQKAMSDALRAAYTQTLTEYAQNKTPGFDPQAAFAGRLDTELKKNDFYSGSQYSTAALKADFISDRQYAELGVDGDFTATAGEVIKTEDDGVLTAIAFPKLSLRWTRAGYESDITTDIVISIPAFSGSLGSCAIAAEGGIEQKSGRGSITGVVYSGADIEITGGSLALGGVCYVADDLLLSGAGCEASLAGEYYGFGSSAQNAGQSSAIVVNGRNSRLDLSGLDKLSLAGFSFIDVVGISDAISDVKQESTGDFTGSSQVLMGQSMAFKANQLAYLAPAECISNYASNPFELKKTAVEEGKTAESEYMAPNVDLSAVSLSGRRLSEYASPVTLYRNLDGGALRVGYVFLRFSSPEAANEYFKAYFEAYPERIEQYMDFYLDTYDSIGSKAETTAAGSVFTITTDEEGESTLGIIEGTDSTLAAAHSFSEYVNMAKLDALTQPLTFTLGGKTAVVTPGDYTVTDGDCLVISGGNVTINTDFNGAVLAEGRVTLDNATHGASVSAAALPVGLLAATTDSGEKLSDYLKAGFGQREASGENEWQADKLVVYENWTKN